MNSDSKPARESKHSAINTMINDLDAYVLELDHIIDKIEFGQSNPNQPKAERIPNDVKQSDTLLRFLDETPERIKNINDRLMNAVHRINDLLF